MMAADNGRYILEPRAACLSSSAFEAVVCCTSTSLAIADTSDTNLSLPLRTPCTELQTLKFLLNLFFRNFELLLWVPYRVCNLLKGAHDDQFTITASRHFVGHLSRRVKSRCSSTQLQVGRTSKQAPGMTRRPV